MRKEKRPDGMKPLGRMKLHYLHCTDIFYIYSQIVPEGEWWRLLLEQMRMILTHKRPSNHISATGRPSKARI